MFACGLRALLKAGLSFPLTALKGPADSGGPREDVGWARDPMLREAALSGRDDRPSQGALAHPAAMLPAFQGRGRIGAAAGARGIGIRTDLATDAELRDAGASEVVGSVADWVEEILG